MKKERTHYDKSFKENAVKLSIERKNISDLAQELGIKPFLLYRWRKEYLKEGSFSFPGNGVQTCQRRSQTHSRVGKAFERDRA
ncbi:MAG: transposase [Bacteroidales bacterium]|jgi:transposase|nr:transposase [Bacteroidales bacterium]